MQLSVFYDHILSAAAQNGVPAESLFEKIKSFGIDAVECDRRHLGENPAAFARLLENSGLRVCSVYRLFDFPHNGYEDAADELVDTAALTGAKNVLAVPGFYSEDMSREETLQKIAASLNKMCEYARRKNITVTLEDFDDSDAPYAQADGLLDLLKTVPLLKIAFDTGNFIYSEADELTAFELLRGRTAHVHCKDRSLERNGGGEKLTVGGRTLFPAPVGSGCIRIAEIVSRLKATGYSGFLSIEHFDAEDQLRYIERSARYLKGLLDD